MAYSATYHVPNKRVVCHGAPQLSHVDTFSVNRVVSDSCYNPATTEFVLPPVFSASPKRKDSRHTLDFQQVEGGQVSMCWLGISS